MNSPAQSIAAALDSQQPGFRAAGVDVVSGARAFSPTLPLRLTVSEFASLVRLCAETVRRMIRSRQLVAHGRPFLIPRGELHKFGVPLVDAAEEYSRLVSVPRAPA